MLTACRALASRVSGSALGLHTFPKWVRWFPMQVSRATIRGGFAVSDSIRALLARLNPKSGSMEMGRGGIPELTPQDIAAALGMVGHCLAREVLCFTCWPDGAKLTFKELDDLLVMAQVQAYVDRRRTVEAAELQLILAKDGHGSKSQAHHAVAEAKSEAWPTWRKEYHAIRRVSLQELAEGNLCQACKGRGMRAVDSGGVAKIVTCSVCSGSGRIRMSEAERARRCDIPEHQFRRHWTRPYDWIYALILNAEREGAALLSRAIGR